jgi:lysozyme
MKHLILFLFLSAGAIGQTLTEYTRHIEYYEGYSPTVYLCRISNELHVGHGLNIKWFPLLRDYKLGERPPESLLLSEVQRVIQSGINFYVALWGEQKWNELHRDARIILVSLHYNLGPSGISKFVNFLREISNRNYIMAAEHLKDSRWYNQVGRRGRAYYATLRAIP